MPAAEATLMAATQRPVRDVALSEEATHAAWHDIPSWFLIPLADKNIPAAVADLILDAAKSA
ncbi:hypothetical protein [Amycolatopsis methanolica]|uniref:hypothetical protein n=1 Tax=Amycolatopsis methanolica TaxID=1814 RepID=UPI0034396EC5